MDDKVKIISINEEKAKPTFYQYDKGQIIQFEEEIPDGFHVLLSNQDSKLADRKVVENNRVAVKDELLNKQGTLIVNVQVVDETSETTTKTIRMSILHRKDANNDIAPENEQTFIQQVQEIMTTTKSIAQSVREDADNGKLDGASAYEVAVESGFEGTEEEWLASLHGKDGADGTDGEDGADGYSPTAEVTKDGATTNLSITDKNGTTTVSVNDGVVPVYDETSDYVVFKNAQNVDGLVDLIYGEDGE